MIFSNDCLMTTYKSVWKLSANQDLATLVKEKIIITEKEEYEKEKERENKRTG